MYQYESIIILDPALAEDGVEAEMSRLCEVVAKKGGEVLEVQRWGKKRLAYEVKKRREGQYVLMKVRGTGEIVADLDRHVRITESILKGVVIRVEESRGNRFKTKSQARLEGSAVTTTQEVGDGKLQ